jgi:hypothetical protein
MAKKRVHFPAADSFSSFCFVTFRTRSNNGNESRDSGGGNFYDTTGTFANWPDSPAFLCITLIIPDSSRIFPDSVSHKLLEACGFRNF